MIVQKRVTCAYVLIHGFFIASCAVFILPLMLVVSASLSNEDFLIASGFSLLPNGFTLDAYKMALEDPSVIVRAYLVTAAQAFLGTLIALALMGGIAYPLSRRDFYFRKALTFFIFFTMLFGGGMIPTYIVFTKWYGLGNSFAIYLVVGVCSAWNIIIIRTFFQSLPDSLVESAKLDGASELRILARIILPLSTPVMATIGFMVLVGKWNDWNTTLIYIDDKSLYTLQYLLQKVLLEAEALKEMAIDDPNFQLASVELPAESLRYALCILAAGPMLVVFPFFQKYFSRGLTIGSVKG